MKKRIRIFATLFMAVMLMGSVSVFAAVNSPTVTPVAPVNTMTSALLSQRVKIKCGNHKKAYERSLAQTITLKRCKSHKYKWFKIKVVKGTTLKSSSKNIKVKKINATTYKISVKNKKCSGKVTIKAPGYLTGEISIVRK